MARKSRYSILLNVEVNVEKAEDGRRIAWVSFKGWKNAITTKPNRFIDTEPIVKMTKENMKYIGEEIFKAAKEMFYEDESLTIESE
jgi:hypothetical protein